MSDKIQQTAAVGLLAMVVISAVGPSVVVAAAPYFADDPVFRDQVTLGTSTGVEVTFPTGDRRIQTGGSLFPDARTIDITSSVGNVTVSGDSNAKITLTQINGTQTEITRVQASSVTKVNPDDKQYVSLRGNFTSISWSGPFNLDDGTTDFTYSSDSGGSVVVPIGSNTTVAAVDDDTGEVLAGNQTSDGRLYLNGLDSGTHDVRLVTTAGALRLSNPYPVGELNSTPNTLAINVTDGDFPQDNVTLQWRVNGTLVETTTVTADGRYSVTIPTLSRGSHTASVTATDSYGRQRTENWTFGTPTKLEIRNVSQPASLITGQTVTATFVKDNTTVQRSTTTGQIDLTGLPADGSLLVTIETNGYVERQYVVRDLAEQQSVFLLPSEEETYEIEFVLEDRSGGVFEPSSTKMIIQRPININGTFKYVTVGGGDFGAANTFITSLAQEQDYRIQVLSESGRLRDIGTYRAEASGTEVIIVGQFAISPDGDSGTAARLTTFTEDVDDDGTDEHFVRIGYRDPDRKSDEINYRIVTEDEQVIVDQSATIDGLSKYVATFQVNETDGVTYELEGNVTRSGEIRPIQSTAGGVIPPVGDVPLDPRWGQLMGLVIIVAGAGLVVIVDSALGALAAVVLAVFVTMAGLTSIPSAAIGLAGAVAVFGIFGRDR